MYLDSRNLTRAEVEELVAFLNSQSVIVTELRLKNNALGNAEAKILARIRNVHYVDLGNNCIGDDGARALLQNPRIVMISFANNRLTDASVRNIIEASDHLDFVNVIENNFTPPGLDRIKKVFSQKYNRRRTKNYCDKK
jgi:hypothetical protein